MEDFGDGLAEDFYVDPSNYKLISAVAGTNQWRIGQRNGSKFQWFQTVSQPVAVDADYDVGLCVQGILVDLYVGDVSVAAHDFGDLLNDGGLVLGSCRSDDGLGSSRAFAACRGNVCGVKLEVRDVRFAFVVHPKCPTRRRSTARSAP